MCGVRRYVGEGKMGRNYTHFYLQKYLGASVGIHETNLRAKIRYAAVEKSDHIICITIAEV